VVRRFLDTLSTSNRKMAPHKMEGRHQVIVVVPDNFSGHMGDNQTYPANHPADRDTGRRSQGRADNNNEPDFGWHLSPIVLGLIIPHGQHIHPPSQKKQRDKPNSHRDNGKLNITALCSGQTAHQPVGLSQEADRWDQQPI